MLNYSELYEVLRKEKYSEVLQLLPKNFLIEFAEYLNDKKDLGNSSGELFQDSSMKDKKQLENSLALFKELILRRKKKLLNLVFVAAETGIMKRDYENMLSFEREVFDKLVKTFEEGDKELAKVLKSQQGNEKDKNKMIIFLQDVEQFVGMEGNLLGPYNKGQLANLDHKICELFVSSNKAKFVDEEFS